MVKSITKEWKKTFGKKMVNKFCKRTFIEKGILKISFQWILIFLALNLYSMFYIFDLLLGKRLWFSLCMLFYSLNNDLYSIHIHVKSFTLLIFIICTYRPFLCVSYMECFMLQHTIYLLQNLERESKTFFFIDNHERQSFLCESERTKE